MRKLILLLIAFIAVVTFIRAFDKTEFEMGSAQALNQAPMQAAIEAGFGN